MGNIKISYIITTYNKLPYLKEVIKRLVDQLKENEELVVVDGASKDGTMEFLEGLYKIGKIHQFVSEPDKGESHGFNKGILMSQGEYIKVITDDDAFDYPLIRKGVEFMDQHPAIDLLTSHTGLINLEDLHEISMYDDCFENFNNWIKNGVPGWFIGLPMIIRRKALAQLGLFNTGVVQVDTDLSLRATSLNMKIAWCTGLAAIRIENPQSNFRNLKNANAGHSEYVRMRYLYDKSLYGSFFSFVKLQTNWLEMVKKPLRPIKNLLVKTANYPKGFEKRVFSVQPSTKEPSQIANAFNTCDAFFDEYNSKNKIEFICK
ncbi:glycosyltransferase family 2 protein [Adhaeribacter terreus]|uniref:Glycosyltransferase family 2 protein n=1 Tax=Adhaeribacter terreus TaxID=529703 RepID=A0ABW0E9E9_9BACT